MCWALLLLKLAGLHHIAGSIFITVKTGFNHLAATGYYLCVFSVEYSIQLKNKTPALFSPTPLCSKTTTTKMQIIIRDSAWPFYEALISETSCDKLHDSDGFDENDFNENELC
jgi:hypothetical protein